MKFDAEHKVIVETMNETEARAFIKFLRSEIAQHKEDIDQAYDLIVSVGSEFHIPVFED